MHEPVYLPNFVSLDRDPGRVKYFNMLKYAPELARIVSEDPRNRRLLTQWKHLGINSEVMEDAYDAMSPESVRHLLFDLDYRKIDLKPADAFEWTEREDSFKMDICFQVAWTEHLAKNKTLPSVVEYSANWHRLNEESYADNLTYRWEDSKAEHGPLTTAAHAKNKLNQYKKFALLGKPPYTEEDILGNIAAGVGYRLRKHYAGSMRECCALYELASSRHDDASDPPTVYGSAILDVSLKADFIGLGEGSRSRPIPVAVYLDSPRSREYIGRKSKAECFTEIHEMPISMGGPQGEIFLPSEKNIHDTRKALNEGKPRKRYYE